MREYCSNGFLLVLFLTGILLGQVSAQHTIKNATLSGVDFSSPGYIDGLPYGVNSTRDYRFQTYYVNHTLKLEVVEFVLEPADKNTDCLYDKVIIYDGYNSSSPVLHTLCGNIAAGTTYTTTGDTVYVVFISDGTHTYKGFKITVYSDGPTTTTSTTTTSTTTTSTTTTATTSSTTATTSVVATTLQSPTTSASGVTSATSNGGKTTTTTPTTATLSAAVTTTSASGVTPTISNVGNQNSDSSGSSYTIWIIVGCSIGGALLLILIIIAVCWYLKSKRPVSPPGMGDPVKRVLWSRTNTTMVQPIEKSSIPPGEVIQTNIFDMELPVATEKANRLPPLSSKLEITPKPALD